MFKIKLTINATRIHAEGYYLTHWGEKCRLDLDYDNEENAMMEFAEMRERDCEFSIVIIRAV